RVQLATDASTTHSVGQPLKETLFELSPSVKGTASWIDARTVEFKPEKEMNPDQLYEVNFKLGKVTNVPSKFEQLRFNFKTIKPSFRVTQTGLRSTGEKDKMFISGEVVTADIEDGKKIETVLSAMQNTAAKKIAWQHAGKVHSYTVSDITRSSSEESLRLVWNGSKANMEVKGEIIRKIPAVGDFKLLDIMAVNDGQQYASVQFSDPIEIGQDLTGMVGFSNETDVSYTINGSEVKLFSAAPLAGNYTVNVNAGIKNKWAQSLPGGFTGNIIFESKKPAVTIIGRGNILPNSGKLLLPFDAINLNAVDISIIKIYENNVPQFFQQNDMGGDNDLRRVAKPIVQKTLRLDDDKLLDLHSKQRFSLDIDKFLKTEPGAIYRVTIGFRPTYSVFSKATVDTTAGDDGNSNEEESYEGYEDEYASNDANAKDADDEFWNSYDSYYPYGYNWERKDDPNSKSYYTKDRWATRNILASNIGLTAKRGNDQSLTVAVSSILSTEPMAGVELQLLDYQKQILLKTTSDADGLAKFDLKRKPYLLLAKYNDERGYLKLDDGSSLPLTRFNVGGEQVQSGLKGFIYGERGVWRPGDPIYLTFILEDKLKTLPANHPVEFELYNPSGQLYKRITQTKSVDGFYSFHTATEISSPTGNWTAKVK
ncbi:MAG: hypothetical protein EOO88_38390, partial [Pedobacter sp.]